MLKVRKNVQMHGTTNDPIQESFIVTCVKWQISFPLQLCVPHDGNKTDALSGTPSWFLQLTGLSLSLDWLGICCFDSLKHCGAFSLQPYCCVCTFQCFLNNCTCFISLFVFDSSYQSASNNQITTTESSVDCIGVVLVFYYFYYSLCWRDCAMLLLENWIFFGIKQNKIKINTLSIWWCFQTTEPSSYNKAFRENVARSHLQVTIWRQVLQSVQVWILSSMAGRDWFAHLDSNNIFWERCCCSSRTAPINEMFMW